MQIPANATHRRSTSMILLIMVLLVLFLFGAACPAPAPRHVPGPEQGSWLYRGGGRHIEGVTGVKLDHAGNVYVAGWFQDRIEAGPHHRVTRGKEDGFLIKLDKHGRLDWVTTLGGVGSDSVRALEIGPMGNIYLAGSYSKRLWLDMKKVSTATRAMWVAKVSNRGAVVWLKSYGADAFWMAGLGVGPKGDVLLAANYEGEVILGGRKVTSRAQHGTNAVLARLDYQGNVRWVVPVSSSRSVLAQGLAVDCEGAAVVTGNFSGDISLGKERGTSRGGEDIFLAKVGAKGVPEWLAAYGGPEDDLAYILCIDERRNTYLAGTLRTPIRVGSHTVTPAGPSDIMVLRTDRTGLTDWATTLGVRTGRPTALAADRQGNVMVAGIFSGVVNVGDKVTYEALGSDDILLAEVNGRGHISWTLTLGGNHTQMVQGRDHRGRPSWIGLRDRAAGLAVTPQGRLIIAGEFVRKMRFGSRTLAARGYTDVFVWQVDRDRIGTVHDK